MTQEMFRKMIIERSVKELPGPDLTLGWDLPGQICLWMAARWLQKVRPGRIHLHQVSVLSIQFPPWIPYLPSDLHTGVFPPVDVYFFNPNQINEEGRL
jgi:hypothetical protein